MEIFDYLAARAAEMVPIEAEPAINIWQEDMTYSAGEQVMYDGEIYISKIDFNTFRPDDEEFDAWEKQEE